MAVFSNILQIIGAVVIVLGSVQFLWESHVEPSELSTPTIPSRRLFSQAHVPVPSPPSSKSLQKDQQSQQTGSVDPSELVSIEMKLQYPTIYPQTSSELREPMLLSLNVNEASNDNRTPLDVVLVLDTSGSMEGAKMDLLKDTLHYLITLFTEKDRISIIRFSHSAEKLIDLFSVSELNQKNFHSIIDHLKASGGTDIASGISEALNVLRRRKENNRVASILVLSDGLDSTGERDFKNLLAQSSDVDGYTIHTFGYGSDHDPKLMSQIANLRDGNFYFIEKLETADESFADALGGLLSVVGEKVTLSVKAVQSPLFSRAAFEKAFGGEFLWKKSNDGWYETSIKQLPSGKNKNFVLMMAIGKYLPNEEIIDPEGVIIAEAKLKMYEAGTKKLIEKKLELRVNITQDKVEFKRQYPDVKVLLNYYRVQAGEVMLESSKLAEQGNYEEGREKLERLRSEMGNSSVGEDGFVLGTMADLNNTILEMIPEGYQAVGKHHIQQNSGSYLSEKSNPYMNNSALSYNTTNRVQGNLVNQTRARRNATNGTNCTDSSNLTNCSNYTNGTNCANSSNLTGIQYRSNASSNNSRSVKRA